MIGGLEIMEQRIAELEKRVAELEKATQPDNIAKIACNAFADVLRKIQGKPISGQDHEPEVVFEKTLPNGTKVVSIKGGPEQVGRYIDKTKATISGDQ